MIWLITNGNETREARLRMFAKKKRAKRDEELSKFEKKHLREARLRVFAKNKIPRKYDYMNVQDMSKFERRILWFKSTSLGQRVGFLVGVAVALALLVALLSLSFGGLLLSILFFVFSISYAFWLRSEVWYEYWKPYSNTPGHGITLKSRVPRATREQVSNFSAFSWGYFCSGFVGMIPAAWLGQYSVDPFASMAGASIFLTTFATGICSLALIEKLR
jgi:hypothetical protein